MIYYCLPPTCCLFYFSFVLKYHHLFFQIKIINYHFQQRTKKIEIQDIQLDIQQAHCV